MNLYQYKIITEVDREKDGYSYNIEKHVLEAEETSTKYICPKEHLVVAKVDIEMPHLGLVYLLDDDFDLAKECLKYYVQSQIRQQESIIESAKKRMDEFYEKLECIDLIKEPEDIQEDVER